LINELREIMKANGVMRDFLKEWRTEVADMLLGEFTEEDIKEVFREEGKEIGKEERSEEVAADCIKMGLSESQTVRLSKLSSDRIAELKRRLRS
jgi:hypothetical protein